MMMPPRRRMDPRTSCELTLAGVRRRISFLELAQENLLAWLCLNGLAIALDLVTPADELARLWFAETLLEVALAWHESRQP